MKTAARGTANSRPALSRDLLGDLHIYDTVPLSPLSAFEGEESQDRHSIEYGIVLHRRSPAHFCTEAAMLASVVH